MTDKQSSSKVATMGELSMKPPESDGKSFNAVVNLIRKYYLPDWEQWEVNNLPFEMLFGSSISPEVEKKIRFALPTIELLQALYPDAPRASERQFRDLKRRLLSWPLGRSLIYMPQSIMSKVHTTSYDVFMETVTKLKPQILSRQSAYDHIKKHQGSSPAKSSSPSQKLKRSSSPLPEETPKRSRTASASPTSPLSEQGEHMLALLLEQQHRQNAMFERIMASNKRHEMTIKILEKKIDGQVEEPPAEEHPFEGPLEELNKSFSDSTQSGDDEEESGELGPSIWAPIQPEPEDSVNRDSDTVENLRHQIADAQRRLLEIQQNSECAENSVDFRPSVIESQVKVAKADVTVAKQGADCQRLGENTWKNIRYSEVQKQFQATPAFSALKVNSQSPCFSYTFLA